MSTGTTQQTSAGGVKEMIGSLSLEEAPTPPPNSSGIDTSAGAPAADAVTTPSTATTVAMTNSESFRLSLSGRAGSGEQPVRGASVSKPMQVKHHIHVSFDPASGAFKGLPPEWGKHLPDGVSKDETKVTATDRHVAPPKPTAETTSIDAEARPTAEQLLNHPFITMASTQEEYGQFVRGQLEARRRRKQQQAQQAQAARHKK
eukprot:evm.model.NODE_19077_length_29818_cov_28.928265.6